MSSRVAASSSSTGRPARRTISTGWAGSTTALTSSATAAPISASSEREKLKAPVGGCRVATSAADTAACVASSVPLPRKMATDVASSTTTPAAPGPVPISSTSRSATAIPSATPKAISAARRPAGRP